MSLTDSTFRKRTVDPASNRIPVSANLEQRPNHWATGPIDNGWGVISLTAQTTLFYPHLGFWSNTLTIPRFFQRVIFMLTCPLLIIYIVALRNYFPSVGLSSLNLVCRFIHVWTYHILRFGALRWIIRRPS